MKRKLNGEKTGATRQRALLLSLETFLAITALPRSTRHERTGADRSRSQWQDPLANAGQSRLGGGTSAAIDRVRYAPR